MYLHSSCSSESLLQVHWHTDIFFLVQTDTWTDKQTWMLTYMYTTQFFPLIWITIAGSLSHRHWLPCTNIQTLDGQTNIQTDKQTNKQTGMLTYTTQLFPLISITTCIAGSLSHRHCLPYTNRQTYRQTNKQTNKQTNRNAYRRHTVHPPHLNRQCSPADYCTSDLWRYTAHHCTWSYPLHHTQWDLLWSTNKKMCSLVNLFHVLVNQNHIFLISLFTVLHIQFNSMTC